MLTTLALPAFNHALRRNAWALERLERHGGKTARIECAPVTWTIAVLPGGELGAAGPDAVPNAVIRLSPGSLLRLLARDERAWSEVRVEGDSDLATALDQVWRRIDWGFEEDLSRVVGDIAAHRLATTARQMRDAAAHALDSVTHNLAEYWTEEQPMLARRRDIEAYNGAIDVLRDDVARIEKRIAALDAAAPHGAEPSSAPSAKGA